MPFSILVIAHDEALRAHFCRLIAGTLACRILSASHPVVALDLLHREHPAVVIVSADCEHLQGHPVAELFPLLSPQTTVLVVHPVTLATVSVH